MVSVVNHRGDAYAVRRFVCDVEDEAQHLPIDVFQGSTAYVIESGNTYIFNGKKQWVLFKSGSGSGNGGSGSGSGSGTGSGEDNPGGDGCGCDCGEDSTLEIIYDGGEIEDPNQVIEDSLIVMGSNCGYATDAV